MSQSLQYLQLHSIEEELTAPSWGMWQRAIYIDYKRIRVYCTSKTIILYRIQYKGCAVAQVEFQVQFQVSPCVIHDG
jgi:hypothetical protein